MEKSLKSWRSCWRNGSEIGFRLKRLVAVWEDIKRVIFLAWLRNLFLQFIQTAGCGEEKSRRMFAKGEENIRRSATFLPFLVVSDFDSLQMHAKLVNANDDSIEERQNGEITKGSNDEVLSKA